MLPCSINALILKNKSRVSHIVPSCPDFFAPLVCKRRIKRGETQTHGSVVQPRRVARNNFSRAFVAFRCEAPAFRYSKIDCSESGWLSRHANTAERDCLSELYWGHWHRISSVVSSPSRCSQVALSVIPMRQAMTFVKDIPSRATESGRLGSG